MNEVVNSSNKIEQCPVIKDTDTTVTCVRSQTENRTNCAVILCMETMNNSGVYLLEKRVHKLCLREILIDKIWLQPCNICINIFFHNISLNKLFNADVSCVSSLFLSDTDL